MYWAWMDVVANLIGDVAINVCKYLTKIYFAKYNLKQNDMVNLRKRFLFAFQFKRVIFSFDYNEE